MNFDQEVVKACSEDAPRLAALIHSAGLLPSFRTYIALIVCAAMIAHRNKLKTEDFVNVAAEIFKLVKRNQESTNVS
jgi:hypothetical protein